MLNSEVRSCIARTREFHGTLGSRVSGAPSSYQRGSDSPRKLPQTREARVAARARPARSVVRHSGVRNPEARGVAGTRN
eukprot:13173173-Alexandrium_andersonii.AAC.1